MRWATSTRADFEYGKSHAFNVPTGYYKIMAHGGGKNFDLRPTQSSFEVMPGDQYDVIKMNFFYLSLPW
jgi:hypothetical protein